MAAETANIKRAYELNIHSHTKLEIIYLEPCRSYQKQWLMKSCMRGEPHMA